MSRPSEEAGKTPVPQSALADTRERALPAFTGQSIEDYLVYLKQVALYEWATGFCAGKVVLDLGCGEGYGSQSLAGKARFVVAADHDVEAVVHAASKYAQDNLAFVVCDAERLPFRNNGFDTVVSFEVIEHVENVAALLKEIRRVRGAGGPTLISTPNRRLRLLPFQKPWNRYHRREYDDVGLNRVLAREFRHVELRGVVATPQIMAIERRRVRQSPWIAYPRMVAHLILPSGLLDWMGRKTKRNISGKSSCGQMRRAEFTVSDYRITHGELRECITLLGICDESESGSSAPGLG